LIHRAEIAAISASAEGTGVAIYAHEQDNKRKENVRLLGELRKAIEEDQLFLHYQPKVHLATGRITGVEALIRWQHPQLGLIPPGRFIPQAERTALIEPLTHWVLETALRRLAEWQHAGLGLKMALNLSTRNLSERDLPSRIIHLLEAYRIEQKQINLEINESDRMQVTSDAVDALALLRDKGVNIAIDDFGTGYSCLAFLNQLPVSSVKLDRSFLARLQTSRCDRVLIQAVIDLCHQLDLEVVAEGVENSETLDLLAKMGCDLAQGYHIGRPVAAQEIEQKFRTGIEKGYWRSYLLNPSDCATAGSRGSGDPAGAK
jgi:EAL domain-containing protein (putative c-di-GMP-specific phosphodiesterase class I)